MSDPFKHIVKLPPEQEAIRAKCFHPSGSFVEFGNEEVEQSIPDRFEKIVRKYPDRLAVKSEHQVLRYAELNATANRLARALIERQGPKAKLVALLLEKDAPQLAAMLGVLKAGKFFLILDPSFPQARIAAMLEDSQAKLVVTNRHYASLAREVRSNGCQLMEWETIDGAVPPEDLAIAISPKALAFINYTSGSTGEPKGLLRTHRMILHNIMLRTNLVHVCEHDRISLLSSGTSNAITNTLLALLNGAALFSLEVKKEGVVRLAGWLSAENITICPMSSPLFRSLCETLAGKDNFPDLRVVRLRSEAVYKNDADLYKTYFSPHCIFVTGLSSNETGPLRDYLIDHETEVNGSAVPVGYAVPDKEILLLDDAGKEVAFNEEGEIAVRSHYISPGYLRRPQLTRAKFKTDPNGAQKRLYRTGDMGVMLPDGCLIYKGRKDFRIKIRGYGVDPKEVETALRAHPAVRDAVVVTRPNQLGETGLVAYFTVSYRPGPTVSELRSFLTQTLADYMIPSVFVKLDSIPLTPHNKVDRNALPNPGYSRPELDTPWIAPRTALERDLSKIWAEVLCVDQIGIHDNFLDLGGHSLAATRIISRVVQMFRVELPIKALFDSPTVAQMATVIMSNQGVKAKDDNVSQVNADQTGQTRRVRPTNDFTEYIEQSIPDRFEQIVRHYPHQLAVKAGDRALTYEELNQATNRIARAILAKSGQGNEPIALLFEHGIDVIAAIFGALKAGKIFLSLDPSFPPERNAFMLGDAQAALIVTNSRNVDLADRLTGAARALLNIDGIEESVSADNLNLSQAPDDVATIRYTSGSTGEPKGVVETHRNILHSVMLHADEMRTCIDDRLSLLHSVSFASAHVNLFQSLLTGASLFPFDVKCEGIHQLAKWLREEQITVYHSPPALFRQLADLLSGQEKLSKLRLIHLSGAPITQLDFDLYKQNFCPGTLLEIGMGSTEAREIGSAFVDETFSFPKEGSPVGYSRPDKRILLLGENGREVGPGQVGEIAVKSRNLNPGYWRRPELTESRFLHDPTGGDERVYLTGDLGRMLPDGFLIHLGRKDFMVKIRGYRVELAEIERALLAHPQVKDAGVAAWDQEPGEKYLVAYVVPCEDAAPTTDELHNFLKEKLPDYMMPSAFMFRQSLPLTNGKLDWTALPLPDHKRPDMAHPYAPPKTEIEQKLVRIWEEVLDVRPIGIHDNFFDLGGHSLLAARVISRIHDEFQVDLSLSRFFETPTVAALADYLETARLREGKIQDLPIRPVSRDEQLPLSFSQQRLWFLDQLEPGSLAYNLAPAYQLTGRLDVRALERTVNEIIRRHEALRTVFKSVDGQPHQVILPSLTVKVPVIDLREIVSDAERAAEVRRLFTAEAQRPFDLFRGPLLRVTLLWLTENEYVLILAIHHIVYDGWSIGILARELSELYEAFSNGKPSPLAELPVQYADFAQWQRQWLQGEVLEEQLAYWKKQLESAPTLQLPTDRPRPAVQTFRGARQSFMLSKDLSETLKKFGRREGVTLFITLLAAYQTLLHRYTGQNDIVIGSPTAGRNRRELEGLIGFFLNMLVLRADLSGNPTFRDLLARVRKVCLDGYAHQDLPFEKLVEEMDPARNLSHNPLFQVTFALQNTPRVPLELAGLTASDLDVSAGIARFDLHLFVVEEESGIRGYVSYNTNLFTAATIERMVGHFQTLLEGIVADPDKRLSDLPLLTDDEKRRLLVEWNDTKADYPREKCIHELFEAQAACTPEAVAVMWGNQKRTYRELNARANQLAHHLRKLGVGPEVMVGICVERSLEMAVGLLGILKAGGAYVPLDPEYPKERLQFMLEDTQAPVLLTQKKLAERFSGCRARLLCLDSDWEEIVQRPQHNPDVGAISNNLAYVIYTSGSTGKPKGVQVPHQSIIRLLFGVDYVKFGPAETFMHLAPTSFDASTFEIWGALLHGAKCVLPADRFPGPAEIGELLHRHKVTTLWLTASLFNLVIDQLPEALSQVRQLLIGGEALSVTHVRRALSLLPSTQIINGYGPTESTTFTCCYRIPAKLDDAVTSIPIGRPIGNTEVYILDSRLNPTPIGMPGELYIGGAGLARGYVNAAELTSQKFIPNPFGKEPGERLYRTGDSARYRANGEIEFLGRLDRQVKLRGFRIEPGEIESALGQHPAVRETVVVAREEGPGERRVVAYVALKPGFGPVTHDLRRFLREKLPNYMIPSAFVYVNSLPLTANGKVNYPALPDPRSQETQSYEYVAPQDETERVLCRVWSEVLGVERVGLDDDFFAIGGHSLLAAKLFARLDESFGRSLPLGVLFSAPTVRLLAEHYRNARAPKARAVVVPLRSTGARPPVHGVPGVFGNVICFAELSRELGSDQPFYGLQSVGLDGAEAPLDSIEQMAKLYVREVRSVQAHGPYAIIGACFGATVAYEMARQLLDAGEEVGFLGLLDPTHREGSIAGKSRLSAPRILKRAAAFGSLLASRLRLYREETKRLAAKDRVKYLASKFRLLHGLIGNGHALKGAERELNQIEVYQANLLALDRYRREALRGPLRALEIFETTRPGKLGVREKLDWGALWQGDAKRHRLPGKDSGDMLTGKNAPVIAALLGQRLRAAFEKNG
jgi:amino acid adenylation domain-containing protein